MKSERFVAGLLCGLVIGMVVTLFAASRRWREVVREYKAEVEAAQAVAEQAREQLLACHQADPFAWALKGR